jgi:hypothetical protein
MKAEGKGSRKEPLRFFCRKADGIVRCSMKEG